MRPEDIEAVYQSRIANFAHARWGWSFMYTPEAALKRAKVAFVGLNPGGRQIDEKPVWEYSGVNAYTDEQWQKGGGLTPLQQQVSLLFNALDVQPREVFAANLIPFRSPSWNDLPDKQGALAFGRSLWTDLLRQTPVRLYVSLGKQSGREISNLIGASLQRRYKVDWGRQTIDEFIASNGRTVLALPHLSRFRIFGSTRTSATAVVAEVAQRIIG